MIFFATKLKKSAFKGFLSALIIFTVINIFSGFASAEQRIEFEPSEKIRLAAKIFLEEMTNAADNLSIMVNIGQLDPRLKLRRCDDKLGTYLPGNSSPIGRVTVGISCKLPVSWKVFVSATVYHYADVIVARNSIAKNSVITVNDIELKRVNLSTLRKQPAINKKQVIDTSPKHFIKAGSIIFEDNICMVCRGDIVQISAKNQFFTINLQGVALGDGKKGETTIVRNIQSKRSFSAKVIGKNQLQVLLATTK